MIRFTMLAISVLLIATSARAQGQTPVGTWLHANGRIRVQISPCGVQLCGTIVWFRWPNDASGRPLVDSKNPSPALRARPLLGLRVLSGLRRSAGGSWGGGKIYNPDDGVSYNAILSVLANGTLRVRAYIGLTLLGQTQIWTRIH